MNLVKALALTVTSSLLVLPSSALAASANAAASGTSGRYETVTVLYQRLLGTGETVTAGQVQAATRTFREHGVSLVLREALRPREHESSPPTTRRWEAQWETNHNVTALPPFDEDAANPPKRIAAEWIDITLSGPDAKPRSVRRWLRDAREADANEDGSSAASLRRYTVTIVPGSVSRAEVERRLRELDAGTKERRRSLEALSGRPADKLSLDDQRALCAAYDRLDHGAAIDHLIALRFAVESDSATARLARSYGVAYRRDIPLVLVTSIEGVLAEASNSSMIETSLDIRLDELTIISARDEGARRLFNFARGVQQSAIEGALMGTLAGEQARGVSTAHLMDRAPNLGTTLLVLDSAHAAALDPLNMPARLRMRVREALDAGREAIIPSGPVDLAGKPRWGFWDVDPRSGVVIGVMEDGQHQGMSDYNLIVREVVLSPRNARMLGLIAGNINVQFGYAALMLEYGDTTPQLVHELEDMLESVACSACPQFKVGAEVSVKLGDDCFKSDIKKEHSLEFCEAYGEGFSCAVGMFIASLRGEEILPLKAEAKAEFKFGCKHASTGE